MTCVDWRHLTATPRWSMLEPDIIHDRAHIFSKSGHPVTISTVPGTMLTGFVNTQHSEGALSVILDQPARLLILAVLLHSQAVISQDISHAAVQHSSTALAQYKSRLRPRLSQNRRSEAHLFADSTHRESALQIPATTMSPIKPTTRRAPRGTWASLTTVPTTAKVNRPAGRKPSPNLLPLASSPSTYS